MLMNCADTKMKTGVDSGKGQNYLQSRFKNLHQRLRALRTSLFTAAPEVAFNTRSLLTR